MSDLEALIKAAVEANDNVAQVRREADEAVALAVAERAAALRAARDAGATWRQLGAALGVSGERAQQAARQG